MKEYTPHQVAKLLNLSPATIKVYCRRGRIRGRKRRVFSFTTPSTGQTRRFPQGLVVWVIPGDVVKRLVNERE